MTLHFCHQLRSTTMGSWLAAKRDIRACVNMKILALWLVIIAACHFGPAGWAAEPTKIVLIGKAYDHPWGSHMYLPTAEVLAKCLRQTEGVEAIVSDGWPQDPEVMRGAAAIVLYTDPGAEYLLDGNHAAEFTELMRGRTGLVTIHWGTAVRQQDLDRLGPAWTEVLGGAWVSNVGIRHDAAMLRQVNSQHPICRGWQEFDLHDEFYLNPTLAGGEPLLQVRTENQDVVVGWTHERPGGGRSFATTLGHYYRNFRRDPFRRMIVNGILWSAGREIPEDGAPMALSDDELQLPSVEPKFEENVMVPMRDGTKLATNIHRPDAPGKYPVILIRSPYGKFGKDFGEARKYVSAGFAMVVQDCRGRGNSEGEWDPFRHEAEDGLDTQNWVGQQPWCDGQIGTAGGSYVGWTQWAPAPLASPYLKTMIPVVPFGDVHREIAYPGGAMQLTLLFGWGAGVGGLNIPGDKLLESLKFLPLKDWNSQFDKEVPYLRDWVAHPSYDDYWKQRSIEDRYGEVRVPTLNIGGWYDIFSRTTIDLVDKVRANSRDRMARRNQFVIIGPWGHGPGGRKLGELDYGDAAQVDLGDIQMNWFRYWLLNEDSGVDDWPAYRIFVMGANRWRDEDEWPLARTEFTKYYLHSDGQANTAAGNGKLSTTAQAEEKHDAYRYDPQDPVPTHGGNNLVALPTGPFDQSQIEQRSDVLVYTSEPLTNAVEVTGPVKLVLYASSSAVDTDFTGKLIDVHPDGKAYNLCDGILRARYRQSASHPELIEPGKVYEYEIDLWVTSNEFQPGHRIRLEVSSSNFPRFDRNPNTGAPFGSSAETQPADQKIYHDADHPSHLLLPIIPAE